MPKVITKLYDRIIKATKKELDVVGYESIKLRNIANSCDIAVGTIYNYFESKEKLVATIISADWLEVVKIGSKSINEVSQIEELNIVLYNMLKDFYLKYKNVFETYNTSNGSYYSNYPTYHSMLRSQIKDIYIQGLQKLNIDYNEDELLILSEMFLACSIHQDIDFEILNKMIKKLLGVDYE